MLNAIKVLLDPEAGKSLRMQARTLLTALGVWAATSDNQWAGIIAAVSSLALSIAVVVPTPTPARTEP